MLSCRGRRACCVLTEARKHRPAAPDLPSFLPLRTLAVVHLHSCAFSLKASSQRPCSLHAPGPILVFVMQAAIAPHLESFGSYSTQLQGRWAGGSPCGHWAADCGLGALQRQWGATPDPLLDVVRCLSRKPSWLVGSPSNRWLRAARLSEAMWEMALRALRTRCRWVIVVSQRGSTKQAQLVHSTAVARGGGGCRSWCMAGRWGPPGRCLP